VTSTSFFDKLKSVSGPFPFCIEMPNFGILNMLPDPSLGTSDFASSILMSLFTSGASTLTFGVAAPNLGNVNVGILSFDGDPSTLPV